MKNAWIFVLFLLLMFMSSNVFAREEIKITTPVGDFTVITDHDIPMESGGNMLHQIIVTPTGKKVEGFPFACCEQRGIFDCYSPGCRYSGITIVGNKVYFVMGEFVWEYDSQNDEFNKVFEFYPGMRRIEKPFKFANKDIALGPVYPIDYYPVTEMLSGDDMFAGILYYNNGEGWKFVQYRGPRISSNIRNARLPKFTERFDYRIAVVFEFDGFTLYLSEGGVFYTYPTVKEYRTTFGIFEVNSSFGMHMDSVRMYPLVVSDESHDVILTKDYRAIHYSSGAETVVNLDENQLGLFLITHRHVYQYGACDQCRNEYSFTPVAVGGDFEKYNTNEVKQFNTDYGNIYVVSRYTWFEGMLFFDREKQQWKYADYEVTDCDWKVTPNTKCPRQAPRAVTYDERKNIFVIESPDVGEKVSETTLDLSSLSYKRK